MAQITTKGFPRDNAEAIIEKLEKGALKPYDVAKEVQKVIGVADEGVATEIRREWVQRKYGIDLSGFSENVDINKVSHDGLSVGVYGLVALKYCGEVPVMAQLLDVTKEPKFRRYPVFMALNEGKVAAGTARGISALEKAFAAGGSAAAVVIRDGMTRDNLVEFDNIGDANKFRAFVESEIGQNFLKEQYDRIGGPHSHSKLLKVVVDMHGDHVYLTYRGTTGAAMGMNFLTERSTFVTRGMRPGEIEGLRNKVKAELEKDGVKDEARVEAELESRIPISLIERVTAPDPITGKPIVSGKVKMITPSGNMATDKKQSATNMIRGRGLSIETEVVLPIEVIKERFFKYLDMDALSAAKLYVKVGREKNERGTRFAGGLASNSSVSNPLEGLFFAYGQDTAQVVESSQVILTFDLSDDDKNVVVHGSFPVMEVGTTGGETGWGIQAQLLKAGGMFNPAEDEEGSTRMELGLSFTIAVTAYEINMNGVQAADELGGTKDIRIRK